MLVRFIGNPARTKDGAPVDKRQTVDWFGKTFALGAEVDVSDLEEWQRTKLGANSHFEVVGGAAEPAVEPEKRRGGRPPKVTNAQD